MGVELQQGFASVEPRGRADFVLPSFKSRSEFGEILSKLNFTKGVEIGVQRGAHAELLLNKWRGCGRFVLVDLYKPADVEADHPRFKQHVKSKDMQLSEMFNRKLKRGKCVESFEQALESPRCGTQLELCADFAHKCADRYADHSFDAVFLQQRFFCFALC